VLDLEPEAFELAGHVGHAFAVGHGARQTTPPFVTSVAIAHGDLREVDDLPLHPSTIDGGVPFLLGSQRPDRVLIVGKDQPIAVSRQAIAVSLVHFWAKIHLSICTCRTPEQGRERRQQSEHEWLRFHHVILSMLLSATSCHTTDLSFSPNSRREMHRNYNGISGLALVSQRRYPSRVTGDSRPPYHGHFG